VDERRVGEGVPLKALDLQSQSNHWRSSPSTSGTERPLGVPALQENQSSRRNACLEEV
jgi:hypothetical protein